MGIITCAQHDAYTLYLRHQWEKADCDGDEVLTTKEIMKLIHAMNLGLSSSYVKKVIREVDVDASGNLDFQEFRELMAVLQVQCVTLNRGIVTSSKRG